MLCTTECINVVFVCTWRGLLCALPCDCPVANKEEMLLLNGEQGYSVGIVLVPVLDTVAGIERIQNASPMRAAHQVDNPIDDDRWGMIKAGAALQLLVPEELAIPATQRVDRIVSPTAPDLAAVV